MLLKSVAICFYLGEKAGRFLGSPSDHPNVLKWSMFHATNVLPTLGYLRSFESEFEKASKDQLDAMNSHLAGRDWFADDYSIADIIPFTRVHGLKHEFVKVSDYPNVARMARARRRAARRQKSDGAEIRLRVRLGVG